MKLLIIENFTKLWHEVKYKCDFFFFFLYLSYDLNLVRLVMQILKCRLGTSIDDLINIGWDNGLVP